MSMFSVDINSANGANYIKPKKGAATKTATPKVAVDMTKNGSLFNDPNIFAPDNKTPTSPLLAPRKTNSSARKGGNSIFNGQMNSISGGRTTTTTTTSSTGSQGGLNSLTAGVDPQILGSGAKGGGSDDDLGIGRDASKGRAAAKEIKSTTSDLRKGISGVEHDGDSATALGKKSQKLQTSLKKTDEKFKERELQQKNQFARLEEERRAIIQEMDSASRSIDDYSRELENELASGSGNFQKIASLRSSIREKNSTITIGNSRVNVIGRSSRTLISEMSRTSKAYVKTNKAHQKDLDKNQEKLEKTLETAAQIEAYSSIVETSGAILENLGMLFKACAGIPIVGAALAAAGAVMQPIGATAKAVGQWGRTAAQVTQTVAYASAGMVQQAFMSAASALQTGAQAVGTTKAMASEWKNLDVELKQVKVDAAEAKLKRTEAKADKAHENFRAKTGITDNDGVEESTNKLRQAVDNGTYSKEEVDKDMAAIKKQTDAYENLQEKQTQLDELKQKKADKAQAKVDAKAAKKADKKGEVKTANAKTSKAKVETKTKSALKAIFSQEGFAVVGQALTLAGMIVAMTENNSTDNKSHGHSDFQVSARAQKIVAQTMKRMGYQRSGIVAVRTR